MHSTEKIELQVCSASSNLYVSIIAVLNHRGQYVLRFSEVYRFELPTDAWLESSNFKEPGFAIPKHLKNVLCEAAGFLLYVNT